MPNAFEILTSPTLPLEEGRYPGFKPHTVEESEFVLHKDVAVPLRDGTTIYIDIYRPKTDQPVPAIIGWSPYGKHGFKHLGMMPGSDVPPEWISKYTMWEGPDPVIWCAQGYAVVAPDPRGAWRSEGNLTFWSAQEGQDGFDVIEWLALQNWCNGKVGMLGVSYLAMSQWSISSTQPPHLAAICPWEGISDLYRELLFHGGIPETRFTDWWRQRSRFSTRPAEDFGLMRDAHPLLDAYWADKAADLSRINVPALVVASWSDQGMHTRGTLEGFSRASSAEKWLMVHSEKKWRHFHDPANVARQKAFFDHFLKGEETNLDAWPKVALDVRLQENDFARREFDAWPIPQTTYRTLFLDAGTAGMRETKPVAVAQCGYASDQQDDHVTFDYVFPDTADVIGCANLRLWVAAESANDLDLFVALQKLDPDGNPVGFRFFATFDNGPVALGWLRASHRKLDPQRSTTARPWLTHDEIQLLEPKEICQVEIEIWPSGTRFEKGEVLRVLIQGNDIYRYENGAPEYRHRTINAGRHLIYTGGEYDSQLVIPIV